MAGSPIATAKSYKRIAAVPLDADQIFEDMASALIFAASPTAVPGCMLTVKDTSGVREIYVVQDDHTLLKPDSVWDWIDLN